MVPGPGMVPVAALGPRPGSWAPECGNHMIIIWKTSAHNVILHSYMIFTILHTVLFCFYIWGIGTQIQAPKVSSFAYPRLSCFHIIYICVWKLRFPNNLYKVHWCLDALGPLSGPMVHISFQLYNSLGFQVWCRNGSIVLGDGSHPIDEALYCNYQPLGVSFRKTGALSEISTYSQMTLSHNRHGRSALHMCALAHMYCIHVLCTFTTIFIYI